MDGMVAMSKATKAITPMMRGNVEYNAEAIRDYARKIEEHAGEAMTKLFPEGSGGMPSEAKDDVWTDWEQFEVLAMQLENLGKGLAQAAANGLAESVSEEGASTNMMGTSGMMGTGGMMGQTMNGMIDIEMLAQMPADAVFAKVGQACSACHTKFRAESN
jgi:cytochrome c556